MFSYSGDYEEFLPDRPDAVVAVHDQERGQWLTCLRVEFTRRTDRSDILRMFQLLDAERRRLEAEAIRKTFVVVAINGELTPEAHQPRMVVCNTNPFNLEARDND